MVLISRLVLLCALPLLSYGNMCHQQWNKQYQQSVCCYNGKTYEPGATITTITTTLECTGDGINTVSMIRPGTYCDTSAMQQHCPCSDAFYGEKYSESESDILIIGLDVLPWRSGPSESFNLPAFTKSDCTVPDLPYEWRDGNSYVGGMTAEGPMICGQIQKQSSCYRLARNGTWQEVGWMKMSLRQHAAAVRLEDGWWVTGGYDYDKQNVDSTELWDGLSWRSHHPLPKPLNDHCLVRLNYTHVFLTGGIDESGYTAASYFYSKATGFVKAPDMLENRARHACGLHHDGRFVFVAGGDGVGYDYEVGKSSEYFDLETLTWHNGPSVDTYDFGYHLVSWGSHTYCIGRKMIWELVVTGVNEDNVSLEWEWVVVGETESNRSFNFQAFLVSYEDCKSWK